MISPFSFHIHHFNLLSPISLIRPTAYPAVAPEQPFKHKRKSRYAKYMESI